MTPSTRLLAKTRQIPQLKTSVLNPVFQRRSFLTIANLPEPSLTQKSNMSTGIPSAVPQQTSGVNAIPAATTAQQQTAGMSTNAAPGSGLGGSGSASDLGIESTDIKTSAGVDLNETQRVLVGSVLDLFAGKPTLKKLALWTDDAKFNDPLTKSAGRKQYSAQWYGLAAAFSEIERLSHSVTSTGNPITMDLKTRYKVKGLGTEKIIESVIKIHTDASGEKIVAVEDRWNGKIPEGAIATAFRNLNAATVPAFVSVPKNEAEEAKK